MAMQVLLMISSTLVASKAAIGRQPQRWRPRRTQHAFPTSDTCLVPFSDCCDKVGDKITLADITVASALVYPMKLVMSTEYRKAFPCVTRWFTTCVNQPQFQAVVGTVQLAKVEMTAPGAPAPPKKVIIRPETTLIQFGLAASGVSSHPKSDLPLLAVAFKSLHLLPVHAFHPSGVEGSAARQGEEGKREEGS